MKPVILVMLMLAVGLATNAQSTQTQISIIPEPVSIQKKSGSFVLPKKIMISAPADRSLNTTIELLKSRLSVATGYPVQVSKGSSGTASIKLMLNSVADKRLGDEGYTLSVNGQGVTIRSNKPAGLFYGVQSFLQLLPAEIEGNQVVKNINWQVPAVDILDYPRLGWRGLMLDVSRHFFTLAEVKQYIDAMVKYKYNMLHMHLTDDEGWRVEIKSLPKLTEVGAWRVNKVGDFGTFTPPLPSEPKTYGGFYTQDQIRELVAYAAARFVNILPEIDVPGHSMAAIASYPELSCTEGADKYTVRAGEPFMDWSHGAPPIALVDNTLCPANEKVYTFMDKVMTEIAQLFPFEYIHVGGDEAPHNFWEKSSQVKALMQKEGLKTIPQVQAYFEKRLEKIVNAKGKKMMGWDEIMEGGISPTAAVMSWRGMKSGIEASRSGHFVVMSPTEFTYIDYMQGDRSTEPPVYASLRLNKTYSFEPVPAGANAAYILGGQANLWTEQIYTFRQAEYMTWPRGFAIAESVWSPAKNKNWNHFVSKTEAHFKRLNQSEIKYSPAMYDPIIGVKKAGADKFEISLSTEIDGLDLYYSFDNSEPDRFYPKYKEPLVIPTDARLFKVISYRGKHPIGRMMTIRVEDLKKRVK